MKEFSHIEVRVVRNQKWLEQYEKKGFFLSESFPLGEYQLPEEFKGMTEADIDNLVISLRKFISLQFFEEQESKKK